MNDELKRRVDMLDLYINELKTGKYSEPMKFVWEEEFESKQNLQNRQLQLRHVRAMGVIVDEAVDGFSIRLKK